MISSISKTEQLKELILKDIKSGRYKAGDVLPSIQYFCRKYEVSKHTVSQALSNLNEIGVLDSSPGRATRVVFSPSAIEVDILYPGSTPLSRQIFWGEVNAGIMAVLGGRLLRVRELSLGNGIADEESLRASSGVVLLGSVKDETLRLLERRAIPSVAVFSRRSPGGVFMEAGLRGAVDSLFDAFAARGVGRIAYLDRFHSGNGQDLDADKFAALRDAAAARGVEMLYGRSLHRLADVYAFCLPLLKERRVEGIVLSSDAIAQAVYRAVHVSGMRIPEDFPVAAFDNLEAAPYMTPSISSIDLRRYEAGALAAEALLDIMDGKRAEAAGGVLDAKFIARESLPLHAGKGEGA